MAKIPQTEISRAMSLDAGKGNQEKCRSGYEKKRRNDTNVMLSNIETLVYSSKPSDVPSKKVGKIQILEKTCKFIRFYDRLVKSVEAMDGPNAVVPSDILQNLFTYSQKGFLLAIDSTNNVMCCSSSAMGCLQSSDTAIVGAKLSHLITINDNDFIMSLINEKRGESTSFYLHFTIIPDSMLTFGCRAFWHHFTENSNEPELSESGAGVGALILACSSLDKLSMYCLPIFNSEIPIKFEFRVSLDGKFTKIDQAVERYTGYTPTELSGRCILDYVNWEQMVELMETMNFALKQCTKLTICLQFCCKSKSWIWIQADIRVSQNLWNSRIDSFVFSCTALDYNEVISQSAATASGSLYNPVAVNLLEPTSSHGPIPPFAQSPIIT